MSNPGDSPDPATLASHRPSPTLRASVGRAAILVLAVAAAVMTCRDQPTAPGRGGVGFLALRPILSGSAAATSFDFPPIDSIRVVAIRPPSDTALDKTVFFSPDSAVLHLYLPVTLLASTETFTVVVHLRAGRVVLYSGTQTVQVTAGVADTAAAATVPLNYTGPGAGISSIRITPRDSVVTLGQTKRFAATADSNGVPVTTFYVAWSTSDTTLAPIDTGGVLRAPAARATVWVRAETPTGIRDSTPVTFIPVPTAVDSVSGGGQTAAVGTRLPLPLRVRVTAADLLGVRGIPVRFQASTGGSVRDSIVVTDTAGYAGDTVTLGPGAGAQSFTATVSGLPVVNFGATALAGPISAAMSVVSVSNATVASGRAVTFLLQGKDAFGNNVTSGGAAVVFSITGGTSTGTIGPTTDHGDGTYSASFVGGSAGTATTVSATVDGTVVGTTLPTVMVTSGVISAVTSVVSTSSALVASGASATLTLQAKDSAGNDLAAGGDTVLFTATGGTSTGTIGSTTDHGDGTYTATFVAESAGTATTIGATVNGVATVSTVALTVAPGNTVAARSVITVAPDTVASGATATITLQAKDSVGNDITTGGLTVVFNHSGGTATGTISPSPATDNGNGTYTATFTGVLAGTATTIGATVDGAPVTSTLPTITVKQGAISATTSVVTVSDSTVATGLVDTLFLQGKDAAGNVLTTGGATVVFTQTGGTSAGSIGATTDLGNGHYRALFTGTTPGTPTTVGATVNGSAVTTTLPTIRVFATSTTHSSDITANETWAAAQNPHIVTGYLRVRSGATLTIGPGALVQFDAGAGLQVGDTTLGESGGLVLDGTTGLITLTANTATPTAGYWRGIELQRTLAVAPWYNVLIEWGGGTRPPAGTVAAEACLLVVNNSGAALVVDSLHIRQCNHAGIHHFGGDLTVRKSEIDSATGSGIHEDFRATLEVDTSRVVGSGQEGLLVASAVAKIRSMAGNIFRNNAIASIHMYAHQLRGFKQQDSIAGNGLGPGGTGDSIVVDSGLVDGGGVGFTLHHQAAPYLFTGPVKIVNASVMLSRGFTAAFAPGAGFMVGDTIPGGDAQLVSQGTADSQVVLHNRPGTAGWPGVFLGRHTAPPSLQHMRIVGGGYDPAASLTANLLVMAAGGSGPMTIDSLTSDSSRGHGVAIVSVPGSGFRVRDDSIRNSGGIGLLVLVPGSAADSISGNVLDGNLYPLSLGAHALPGLGLNTVPGSVRDTLLLSGGQVTANATLPYVPGTVWRAMGGVVVDSGAVLTIAAKDTVAFDTSAGIVVGQRAAAALAADGSAGMILFTASAPLPWGWQGIEWHLMSGSGSTTSNAFRYVDVDRAGYSVPCYGDCNAYQYAALRFTDSLAPTNVNLPADHIIVRRSNSYALDFRRGGTGTVNIQSSQFYDNLPDPMIRTLSGHGSQLTIGTSDLYHYRAQAIQGIYKSADPADSVTATNNWWGDVAGIDTGWTFQDSLGRTSTVFGAVRTVPFATTAFFPVGPAAGVVTTQDSVLSPNPALSTADSIRVRVVDASGRGVGGQSVNWTVQPAAGSSVTPVSGTGDVGGRVDALWTFTTQAGTMVATATGPAGAGRYYANVQPALTVTGPNWTMLPALTQGTVPGARLVTFTSTNRRGVLVSNSVDQYGNATHVASICFADPNGICQYTYGQVDSTHSGASAGDTVFFHTSVTTPASYVLRGVYNLATGGQKSDSIQITMTPTVAGVKIDRNAYDYDGVQITPDTVYFFSICPSGQPNAYCQIEYRAFVVDSGLTPVGNQSARLQWTLVPAAGAPVTVATHGVPANDSALVTALANGFVQLVVKDTSANNFGADTMPILVQQLPGYIVVLPDTASVLVGGTATFTGTAVDAGGDTIPSATIHWRPANTYNPHITITDSSVAGQVTVRLDSTPLGYEHIEAFAVRGPGDTAYGFAQVINPVWSHLGVDIGPWAIAANPSTHAVYVGHANGALYGMDGAAEKLLDSVSVGQFVGAVAVNPLTDRVYATSDQGLKVLSGALGVLATVSTGTNQLGASYEQGLTVDSVNNRIYLTANIGSAAPLYVLRQVDGATNTLVSGGDAVLPGLGAAAVFNPADGLVYVAIPDSDMVVAVDPSAKTIAKRIPVGLGPCLLALNPVTNKIYVINGVSEDVSVIAAASGSVINTVSLYYYPPGGIAVDAVNNRIYVGLNGYPYAVVIDGGLDVWYSEVSVGDPSTSDAALGVAYDAANGRVFTANYTSNSVTTLKF